MGIIELLDDLCATSTSNDDVFILYPNDQLFSGYSPISRQALFIRTWLMACFQIKCFLVKLHDRLNDAKARKS